MKQRFITLDAVKVLAAISIIWLHTVMHLPQLEFTSVLGRFAVPFFACTSVFIIFIKVINQPKVGFREYLISRLKRIYLPFLTWSIIYLLIRYGKCWITNLCTKITLDLDIFWTGTANHLWFLPFILVVSLSAFLLAKFVARYPKTQIWLALIALMAGILVLIKPNYALTYQIGYTFALSYQALPAVLWAISLAILDRLFNFRDNNNFYFLPWLSIVMVISFSILMLVQGRNLFLENIGGVCLLLFSLTYQNTRLKILEKIAAFSSYSYGIYLVHILFVEGFQQLANLMNISATTFLYLGIFLLSLILSMLTIFTLKKCKMPILLS